VKSAKSISSCAAGSAESLMVRAAQQIGFTRWKISRRHSAKKIGCRLARERCFKLRTHANIHPNHHAAPESLPGRSAGNCIMIESDM